MEWLSETCSPQKIGEIGDMEQSNN
jgi:hypothetical protein